MVLPIHGAQGMQVSPSSDVLLACLFCSWKSHWCIHVIVCKVGYIPCFFHAECITDDKLWLRKWIFFWRRFCMEAGDQASIAFMWLLCSWLILSNSFTSAERGFYLKPIQRFASTNWTIGFRKSLLKLPIIDFLIGYSWNTSRSTATLSSSAGLCPFAH